MESWSAVVWEGPRRHTAPVVHVGQLEGWSRQQGPMRSRSGRLRSPWLHQPQSVGATRAWIPAWSSSGWQKAATTSPPPAWTWMVLLHGTRCPLPPTTRPCSVTAHPRAPAASSVPPGTGTHWKPSTCASAALEALRVSLGRVYWLAVPSRGHFSLCNPFTKVEIAF